MIMSLWANPDDDHGEDPGVDEVLDPVADCVDGEEASLEVGVEVPTQVYDLLKVLQPRQAESSC